MNILKLRQNSNVNTTQNFHEYYTLSTCEETHPINTCMHTHTHLCHFKFTDTHGRLSLFTDTVQLL